MNLLYIKNQSRISLLIYIIKKIDSLISVIISIMLINKIRGKNHIKFEKLILLQNQKWEVCQFY